MKCLWKLALSSVTALFFVGSAHAYVIDFENVDITSAPFAPLLGNGDYITQGGYFINMQNVNNEDGLLGQLSYGKDPDSCLNGSCPSKNATNFLSVFNDGMVHIGQLNGGALVFGGLSAAYLPVPNAPAGSTVYLGIEADRANGSYASFYYPLTGDGAFQNIGVSGGIRLGGTGALTDGDVTDLFIYGYFCNGKTGSCSAFKTNNGQFALDNVILNAVPEPETYGMLVLGLGLLGIVARRKKSAP